MLEIIGVAALLGVLAFGALVVGLIVTILKVAVWLVVWPLRLIGKLLWLPVMAIGTLAGGVILGALFVLPLLPFVLLATLAWMVVKRSRRARLA